MTGLTMYNAVERMKNEADIPLFSAQKEESVSLFIFVQSTRENNLSK